MAQKKVKVIFMDPVKTVGPPGPDSGVVTVGEKAAKILLQRNHYDKGGRYIAYGEKDRYFKKFTGKEVIAHELEGAAEMVWNPPYAKGSQIDGIRDEKVPKEIKKQTAPAPAPRAQQDSKAPEPADKTPTPSKPATPKARAKKSQGKAPTGAKTSNVTKTPK